MASTWTRLHFDGNHELFKAFIRKHQVLGQPTDDYGIIVQATAMYLGTLSLFFIFPIWPQTDHFPERNVHLYSTTNRAGGPPYTLIDLPEGTFPQSDPLVIGFYPNPGGVGHFVSLKPAGLPTTITEESSTQHMANVTATPGI